MQLKNSIIAIIVLFIMCCSSRFAHAQRGGIIRNQGFYLTLGPSYGQGIGLETDYGINTDIFSPYFVGIKTSINQYLGYKTSVGAGIGYMRYVSPRMNVLPISVNFKYFFKEIANTFLIYTEGGFAPRLESGKQNKGFIYEAGLGYRLNINRSNSFILFQLGYNSFKTNNWDWSIRQPDFSYDDPYKWYYLKRSSIILSVSFTRSYR